MLIKVSEIEYLEKGLDLPLEYEVEIEDSLTKEDDILANEVVRIIREKTGANIVSALVDV